MRNSVFRTSFVFILLLPINRLINAKLIRAQRQCSTCIQMDVQVSSLIPSLPQKSCKCPTHCECAVTGRGVPYCACQPMINRWPLQSLPQYSPMSSPTSAISPPRMISSCSACSRACETICPRGRLNQEMGMDCGCERLCEPLCSSIPSNRINYQPPATTTTYKPITQSTYSQCVPRCSGLCQRFCPDQNCLSKCQIGCFSACL